MAWCQRITEIIWRTGDAQKRPRKTEALFGHLAGSVIETIAGWAKTRNVGDGDKYHMAFQKWLDGGNRRHLGVSYL